MSLDLVVHPVRSRVLVLLMGRRLSTSEIADRLPDVPKPSLYRHLQKMVQGGVLRVVEEKPVRGAVEKFYESAPGAGELSPEELATKEGQSRAFSVFLGVLSSRFRGLTEHPRYSPERDGIPMFAAPVHLSRSEWVELNRKLHALLREYARSDRPDRGRMVVSVVAIPDEPLP